MFLRRTEAEGSGRRRDRGPTARTVLTGGLGKRAVRQRALILPT